MNKRRLLIGWLIFLFLHCGQWELAFVGQAPRTLWRVQFGWNVCWSGGMRDLSTLLAFYCQPWPVYAEPVNVSDETVGVYNIYSLCFSPYCDNSNVIRGGVWVLSVRCSVLCFCLFCTYNLKFSFKHYFLRFTFKFFYLFLFPLILLLEKSVGIAMIYFLFSDLKKWARVRAQRACSRWG